MATSSNEPKKQTTGKKASFHNKKAPQKKVTARSAVEDTEKVVDSTVQKVTQKASSHVSPETREKAKQFAHQADSFASEVEKFGDKVGEVADSILPPTTGSEGFYTAEYTHHVSRLFIFRCLWLILQWPILAIWGIWYTIVTVVHYISMFISWKRTKTLREKQARFRRHVIARKSYMNALTDSRPDIIVD